LEVTEEFIDVFANSGYAKMIFSRMQFNK
jgi:hypothetical protein